MGVVLVLCVVAALVIRATVSRSGGLSSTIVLIGDSITHEASDLFVAALAPTTVDVLAVPGRTIPEQIPVAKDAASRKPGRVVINLGSNDVLTGVNHQESVEALREMVGFFLPGTCIHLVTISESFFAIFPEGRVMHERAVALNDEIRKIAAERRFPIIEWSQMVDEAVAQSPPLLLTTDSIHPNDEGKARLVRAYADSLARGCG